MGTAPSAFADSKTNWTLSAGIRQPLLTLLVNDDGIKQQTDHSPKSVEYAPEIPTIGSVGIGYKSFSTSYSHNLDGEDEDKLDYTDYRLGLFIKSFGFDASYTDFQHFKIVGNDGFSESLDSSDVRRVTMASRFMAANAYWFPLRFGFELDTSLDPSEKKHGGIGIGAIGSYVETDIITPDGLIPKKWQKAFGADGAFEAGELQSMNLQGAVGVTLAPGPFYVTGLAAIGTGKQTFAYETSDEQRTGDGVAEKDDYRFGIGYAADHTFFAVQYSLESPRYILQNMSISADSSDLSAQFGVKF